jgi:hypothetical protein
MAIQLLYLRTMDEGKSLSDQLEERLLSLLRRPARTCGQASHQS